MLKDYREESLGDQTRQSLTLAIERLSGFEKSHNRLENRIRLLQEQNTLLTNELKNSEPLIAKSNICLYHMK